MRLLKCTAIAAAVVFVLFFVAIPSFDSPPRLNANESAAIATLKNLHSAQEQFRAQLRLDRDGDGIGEFGWFDELSNCEPPVLSKAFALPKNGTIVRSGYRYRLWLPGAPGFWVHGGSGTRVATDAAEAKFCIYAWPDSPASGKRAFFVDQNDDVWATGNEGHRYVGAAAPPADAAMPSEQPDAVRAEGGRTGRDGSLWIVVN